MVQVTKWLVLLASMLAGATQLAHAQDCLLPVEEWPELRSGGGSAGIVAAVQRQLKYPQLARRARLEGRVFVGFTVTTKGLVEDVRVLKGLRPDCDLAAVQAVRQLPRFKPGKQLGRPVACGYTVPVRFSLPRQKTVP